MTLVRFSALLSVAAALVPGAWAASEPAMPPAPPIDRAQVIHVLNRMTFGIRPGDIETVQKEGLQTYIEQQLHPEKLDDSAVEAQFKDYPLLHLSQSDLHQLYDDQRNTAKKIRDLQYGGKKSGGDTMMEEAPTMREESMMESKGGQMTDGAAEVMETAASATPEKGRGGKRLAEMVHATDLMKLAGNYNAAPTELSHAKLIRAIDSPRQLQEVLVDFWGNHFNVDVKKGRCVVYKVSDDREVIRPNVFGNFRDMLGASAKSPAMLFYLDNVQNSVPAPAQPQQKGKKGKKEGEVAAAPKPSKKRALGINENYAREIMELHTLGVDAGYTQKDVQEVARCFTGWTIDRKTGLFTFDAIHHDNGPKTVLGHQIPANGGMKDGEMIMDILAAHPATAQHIARKLCQRFVTDEPSPELVNKIATVFTQTKGDLRAVTEAILTSPEFLDPKNYANKIKSPFEFVVSAVRASGSEYNEVVDFSSAKSGRKKAESAALLGKGNAADTYANAKAQSLAWHVLLLGQPLFACTPPTGYKEVSEVWVNPGALIARLNFAMALTEGKVADIRFSAKEVIGSADLDKPEGLLDQCVTSILQKDVSPTTKAVLTESALPQMGGQTVNPNKLIALVIGSPEFQRK